MVYVSKGGFGRAITSAVAHGDNIKAIIWAPVKNDRLAFVAEYLLQNVIIPNKRMERTYNKIWSPGKKFFESICGVYL